MSEAIAQQAQAVTDVAIEASQSVPPPDTGADLGEVMDSLVSGDTSAFAEQWQQMQPMVIDYGIRIIAVFGLLFIGWLIASWLKQMVLRGLNKSKFDQTLGKFFAAFSKWAVLIFTALICLNVFGIEATSAAAVIAAAGLAVGLAFQGTLSNFAAGVMLLAFRPFKVGDFVKISGEMGTIHEIELFVTKMNTPDNRRIILPNAGIFGSTIENITHNPIRRVNVSVGTEYTADLDRVREVLHQAIKKVDGQVPDNPPQVILLELGSSSINWGVRIWVPTGDYWTKLDELTRAVKMSLDEARLGIPFPQLDVHLDKSVAS